MNYIGAGLTFIAAALETSDIDAACFIILGVLVAVIGRNTPLVSINNFSEGE